MSRRWNEVISGNDRLWKQICTQHGFSTVRHTAVSPSKVEFTKPCTDCSVNPSSDDSATSAADSTVSSHSESSTDTQATEHSSAVTGDDCSDFQSQSGCCHRFLNYKEIFASHKRIFGNFADGRSLTACVISGFSNRITAIDYHNGYLATGRPHAVCCLYCTHSELKAIM